MFDYLIILQNSKTRLYNLFGWLIILGNAAFFLYLAIFAVDQKIRYSSIALLALLLLTFFAQRFFKPTAFRFGFHPYFLLLMTAWIGAEVYWMAAAMVVFDILHSVAIQKLTVQVGKNIIRYPSLPPKKIEWVSLNNIMLKDGLLTIDFKNNKLIQQPVDEGKTSVKEAEFNDFCRQQLSKCV